MTDAGNVTQAFVEEARATLRRMHGKIAHCLGQLSDDDVNWRPFAGANSIANMVVHLCGNVGQWIVAAVGGGAAERDRPGEFAQSLQVTRDELLKRLESTVRQADAAIAAVTAQTAVAPRTIQGFETNVIAAIFHAISHFEGHTHQIIYVTRLRLGDRYQFKWVPSTPEQVSAGNSNSETRVTNQ
jgi:hypothetical protein